MLEGNKSLISLSMPTYTYANNFEDFTPVVIPGLCFVSQMITFWSKLLLLISNRCNIKQPKGVVGKDRRIKKKRISTVYLSSSVEY